MCTMENKNIVQTAENTRYNVLKIHIALGSPKPGIICRHFITHGLNPYRAGTKLPISCLYEQNVQSYAWSSLAGYLLYLIVETILN